MMTTMTTTTSVMYTYSCYIIASNSWTADQCNYIYEQPKYIYIYEQAKYNYIYECSFIYECNFIYDVKYIWRHHIIKCSYTSSSNTLMVYNNTNNKYLYNTINNKYINICCLNVIIDCFPKKYGIFGLFYMIFIYSTY